MSIVAQPTCSVLRSICMVQYECVKLSAITPVARIEAIYALEPK